MFGKKYGLNAVKVALSPPGRYFHLFTAVHFHEIRTQFTLSSHSQDNKKDANSDPCEWKKNRDNEATVHQRSGILVCGTLGNILLEFLGAYLPCKRGGKGDFMTKHGHIHTRFHAHSKGTLSPIHKGYTPVCLFPTV